MGNGGSWNEIETVTRSKAGLIIENDLQYTEGPVTCSPAEITIGNQLSTVGERVTFDYVTMRRESEHATYLIGHQSARRLI